MSRWFTAPCRQVFWFRGISLGELLGELLGDLRGELRGELLEKVFENKLEEILDLNVLNSQCIRKSTTVYPPCAKLFSDPLFYFMKGRILDQNDHLCTGRDFKRIFKVFIK